jgi:murein L,D-transpeptidase YafK
MRRGVAAVSRLQLSRQAVDHRMLKRGTALVLFVFVGVGPLTRANAESLCQRGDARVVVDLKEHMLVLCYRDKVVESFGVRLGRGGVGKSNAGDHKTPIGTYSLGQPRASKQYGIFIPIGYPTPEQRKNGLTGGAVGVHGPDRRVKWLGRLVNTFDTSYGCVGLAKDEEMEMIAKWVRRAKVHTIELR